MKIALFEKRRRRKLASKRRIAANRAVVRYKVRRGEWRTKAETCRILGLPASADLPRFVLKAPLAVLAAMKNAAARRMMLKMEDAELADTIGLPRELQPAPEALPEEPTTTETQTTPVS